MLYCFQGLFEVDLLLSAREGSRPWRRRGGPSGRSLWQAQPGRLLINGSTLAEHPPVPKPGYKRWRCSTSLGSAGAQLQPPPPPKKDVQMALQRDPKHQQQAEGRPREGPLAPPAERQKGKKRSGGIQLQPAQVRMQEGGCQIRSSRGLEFYQNYSEGASL